ncbi:MAG: hypothetical protein JAY97_16015 [Candidatus Thiodiazotropha sp. 'RUGA']|nr:hypothetical protein [Candidatus Thiodiazotropha sp. 'RUGA']
MTIIVSKDVLTKNLDSVSFTDPFSESTTRIKKSLVLASFIGLIIGTYSIQINGFLGLDIPEDSINAPVLSGILSIIIIYFIVLFTLNLVIELLAWDFKRERIIVSPYVEQMMKLQSVIDNLEQTLETTNSNIENIYSKIQIAKHSDELDLAKLSSQEIIKIRNDYNDFKNNTLPILIKNEKTIYSIRKLNVRLAIRFLSLIFIDIIFPVLLCYFALSKTLYGMSAISSALI